NGLAHNFDYGNRLRSVSGVESYRYDAYGRRVRAWTPSQGLLYSLYSHAGQLLWQRDARAGERREYIYLQGSLVAQRTRGLSGSTATVTYRHTDALGTPVVETSQSRTVLQRREYEPYGKLLNAPLESGPGYTGHDTDVDTGYTYMQQRYFDPGVGQFLSVDPVTAYSNPVGQFHRYRYANNNPYKFSDPDGRNAVAGAAVGCAVTGPACPAGAVIGAVVGTIVGVSLYYGGKYLYDQHVQRNEDASQGAVDKI